MSFVYLAVFADGTSYVGQTINDFEQLEARYKSYTKRARRLRPSEQACFALGMPALGVIEYCPPEKLNEREKYWIAKHRQDGENLNVAGSGNSNALREADKLRRMESKLAKAARRMAK